MYPGEGGRRTREGPVPPPVAVMPDLATALPARLSRRHDTASRGTPLWLPHINSRRHYCLQAALSPSLWQREDCISQVMHGCLQDRRNTMDSRNGSPHGPLGAPCWSKSGVTIRSMHDLSRHDRRREDGRRPLPGSPSHSGNGTAHSDTLMISARLLTHTQHHKSMNNRCPLGD